MIGRPQFSDEDEERGHAAMLARVEAERRRTTEEKRRARVLSYPAPDHVPSTDTFTIRAFGGEVVREDREWCCDWHRYSSDSYDQEQETP